MRTRRTFCLDGRNIESDYLGTAEGGFKQPFHNHKMLLNNVGYSIDKTFPKFVWEMKKNFSMNAINEIIHIQISSCLFQHSQ